MSHFGWEFRRVGVLGDINKLAGLLEPFHEQARFLVLIAFGARRWGRHDFMPAENLATAIRV